jgi:PAS domain S-box-containing protein
MNLPKPKTKNTFRTLQQRFQQQIKEQNGSIVSIIFNQANILLLIIATFASWATWLVGQSTDSLNLVIPLLIVQTIVIIIYFITDKFDNINIRILLISYLLFYSYILFNTDILSTGVWFMLSFVLFAFAAVGSYEGSMWNSFLIFLILFAVFVNSRDPSFVINKDQIYLFITVFITAGSLGYLIDHTARIDARLVEEQARSLEESNAKYDVILNSIGDGLIATDEKGIVEFINHKAIKLLGINRTDIIGQPLNACVLTKDEQGHIIQNKDRVVSRVLRDGEPITLNQTSKEKQYLVRGDETTFPVAMAVTPVKVFDQLRGIIMLFHDMSDEEAVDRAKSEFVSLASHQLRTPLNVISWYVEKLQSEKRGKLNEHQSDYLQEIGTNNKRMIGLVGDLLNVSRIELGRVKLKYVNVDLLELIDQLIKEVQPIISEKKLHFTKDIRPEKATIVNGDISVTTVIVQNLISNAIKYTPEKGTVSLQLTTVMDGDILDKEHQFAAPFEGCLLKVADSGVGIPQAQQEKIFSKLFRADNVQEMDVSGTGLGLYVTQSFVEALGGRIWFESTEGNGTTFYVYLPYDMPRKQESA